MKPGVSAQGKPTIASEGIRLARRSQWGLRRRPRQWGAQGDDTIMCQSTGCSDPLPLLPRLDHVLQTDLT
jgi:hypothetical protein